MGRCCCGTVVEWCARVDGGGSPPPPRPLVQVAACHAKNVWVMLDVVGNHMGGNIGDIGGFTPFNDPSHCACLSYTHVVGTRVPPPPPTPPPTPTPTHTHNTLSLLSAQDLLLETSLLTRPHPLALHRTRTPLHMTWWWWCGGGGGGGDGVSDRECLHRPLPIPCHVRCCVLLQITTAMAAPALVTSRTSRTRPRYDFVDLPPPFPPPPHPPPSCSFPCCSSTLCPRIACVQFVRHYSTSPPMCPLPSREPPPFPMCKPSPQPSKWAK
jgi:hypothetical protein